MSRLGKLSYSSSPMASAHPLINDPNFPKAGLSITPSYDRFVGPNKRTRHSSLVGITDGQSSLNSSWARDTEQDIDQYGIAGRVWEAAYIFQRYLTPSTHNSGDDTVEFEPPCPFFDEKEDIGAVIELGAGVGLVGIHLAQMLSANKRNEDSHASRSKVILTDLDHVLPLLRRNVDRAAVACPACRDITLVRPLPWGSEQHAQAIRHELDRTAGLRLTHVICSDLVYFPELLPPLLRTLLYLTSISQQPPSPPPRVLISYKIRSLAKEEPFWQSFGVWFTFVPVLVKHKSSKDSDWSRFGSAQGDVFGDVFGGSSPRSRAVEMESINDDDSEGSSTREQMQDSHQPSDDELFLFIAERKQDTLACTPPADDEQLMSGHIVYGDGTIRSGKDLEAFEFMLMASLQA